LALNAQNRLDVLERAARERDEERRAQEAARVAAQQRAENEKLAKEAARIAELRAENERRAKQTAESEAQKKEKAERIAAAQAEIDRRAKDLAESEKQKVQLTCTREQARLDDLKAAGNSASVRDDLKQLSQDLTCDRLRPQVVASLDKVTSELNKTPANTPELVRSAQKELARLGCYSGGQDGKFDAATKGAIKKYQAQKGQPATDTPVTDSFISDLGKQKLRVCPAVIVDKPKPKNDHKEAKQEQRSKPAESKPKATQQASGGGGGHATMIGIGF
jgi:chromosome segregation ATPase